MILILKEAGWSVMRPLLKLQKSSVGVNENRILQLAGMEKERKIPIKEKVVEQGNPASTYNSF